jgi:hypothetical protein
VRVEHPGSDDLHALPSVPGDTRASACQMTYMRSAIRTFRSGPTKLPGCRLLGLSGRQEESA